MNEDGGDPDGPMSADILRDTLCSLTERSAVSLRIEPREEDSRAEIWAKSGTAAELLRLPQLRAAACR